MSLNTLVACGCEGQWKYTREEENKKVLILVTFQPPPPIHTHFSVVSGNTLKKEANGKFGLVGSFLIPLYSDHIDHSSC